jgi:3-hydroxy-9,10-secoandrosta-1,3,5(10)-triene-9,17-dione monooxygenase reductase component
VGISPEQFKSALGRWPSGVSVVTACSGGTPAGMTVSSFFSVSLNPPLIAVSIDVQALTLSSILASGFFAVNVLSLAQAGLSDRFATKDNEETRFDGVPLLEATAAHNPLLAGAVVHLDCQLEASHPAGDHVLCIGRILLALSHPGEPLLYQGANYHRLAPLNGSRH